MTTNLANPQSETNPILSAQLNWTAFNPVTNSVFRSGLSWPQTGGSINFDLKVHMPASATCGSNFNFSINVNAAPVGGNETDNVSLNLFVATPVITVPANVCVSLANCNVSFDASYSIIQYSISPNSWTINGNPSPYSTSLSNITLSGPAGYTGNVTLIVTINGCSKTKNFWVGSPPAPASINWDQWIGHNCYSWAEWNAVPGVVNYSYQWGPGTGTNYGPLDTTTNLNTYTGWAPSTTLHVRVKANNVCGSSAWQVKQGTTPPTPNYPNCNGN